MANEASQEPSDGGHDKRDRFDPLGVLFLLIWLSAFVARGAVANDWHRRFFEWYSILVICPLAVWTVWYLAQDSIRKRRRRRRDN